MWQMVRYDRHLPIRFPTHTHRGFFGNILRLGSFFLWLEIYNRQKLGGNLD